MENSPSFAISFKCNTQSVRLSFNTVTPKHLAVAAFDNMVHVIDDNFYTESSAATPREVAPIAGMSVGTMPRMTRIGGTLNAPNFYRAYAADSKLYDCYQNARKAIPALTTPEQHRVVEQFFASAAKAFPNDMGIECSGSQYNPIRYMDLQYARKCQATVEAFWGNPYTVYSHTGWFGFGSLKGYTIEPSCNAELKYNNSTVGYVENIDRCLQGRNRMGMPSVSEAVCGGKENSCDYYIRPKSANAAVTSAAK